VKTVRSRGVASVASVMVTGGGGEVWEVPFERLYLSGDGAGRRAQALQPIAKRRLLSPTKPQAEPQVPHTVAPPPTEMETDGEVGNEDEGRGQGQGQGQGQGHEQDQGQSQEKGKVGQEERVKNEDVNVNENENGGEGEQ
jgi:hypothetical protein